MNPTFRIVLLLIFTFQFLLSSQLNLNSQEKEWLEENPTVLVSTRDSRPYVFNQDGKMQGFTIDLLEIISKKVNINFEYRKTTLENGLKNLQDGSTHLMTSLVQVDHRKEYAYFGDSWFYIKDGIFTLRKNKHLDSLEKLKNKTLVFPKGYAFVEKLKKFYPSIKIIYKDNTKEILQAVINEEAHAAIYEENVYKYEINKNRFNNLVLSGYARFIKDERLKANYFVVSKKYEVLHNILNKAYKDIESNELLDLWKKWFELQSNNIINTEIKQMIPLTKEERNYLNQKEQVTMCVLPNWLPFEQIDENGKHKGIGADMIKIISEKLNKPFVLVPTKHWGESLENIKNKKCDILPVVMDIPSRRAHMNFTKTYTKEPFVIATKPDEIFIKDSSELDNKTVGIVKDYAFIDVLKEANPNINIVPVLNAKDGLEKVRSGELYGYVDIISAIVYTIQENSMLDLKIAGKLEFDIKLSIASRNDEPLLNSIMQKSLDSLDKKQLRDIISRWLSLKIEQKVDYTLVLLISIFFILIILVVLYKNREVHKLNKKLISTKDALTQQQVMINKYVMILTTDLKGQITDVNQAYCDKVGFSKEELIGSTLRKIRHPKMSKEIYKKLWKTIKSDKVWSSEIQNLTKNKENIYLKVIIESLYKDGKKVGYRSISEDITDKKRIEELSITDKLTGLYNRLKTDELLLKQIEQFKRYETQFSIILLDIDNFKNVNDTYGHDVGDKVITNIASILKENIRKVDEAGRWGGEEFIIICTNTSSLNAKIVAENIRQQVEYYNFDEVGKLTVSLGVTSFNKDDNATSLFKRVDSALYKAKNNGKNRTISL